MHAVFSFQLLIALTKTLKSFLNLFSARKLKESSKILLTINGTTMFVVLHEALQNFPHYFVSLFSELLFKIRLSGQYIQLLDQVWSVPFIRKNFELDFMYLQMSEVSHFSFGCSRKFHRKSIVMFLQKHKCAITCLRKDK